ncbi:hypothetical protein NMY22_g3806 [Coprinellus aureogranulatus]|nr:hypothetical protein NMY22_g3806 [Coprinellus aureogranulatus]
MPSIQDLVTQKLSRRDEDDNSKGLNPIYIAGIVVVGVIVLALGVWLLVHTLRKRAAKKRINMRESAFLSVRGVVKEGHTGSPLASNEKPQLRVQTNHNGFSRNQMHGGIAMPERTLAPRSKEEIMNYHRQSGNFPKPFSFAVGGAGSPDPGLLTEPDRFSSAFIISFLLPTSSFLPIRISVYRFDSTRMTMTKYSIVVLDDWSHASPTRSRIVFVEFFATPNAPSHVSQAHCHTR